MASGRLEPLLACTATGEQKRREKGTEVALAELLWRDILLLARVMQAERIDFRYFQPRLHPDWHRAQDTLRDILAAGIDGRLRGAERLTLYSYTQMGLMYRLHAPHIVHRLQSSRTRRRLERQPPGIWYGYRNDDGYLVGVDAQGMGDGLYLFFFHVGIDARWYREGFRLAAAWRHMLSLPQRLHELLLPAAASSGR